jgi:RNA polymerase subunit RPABC4/transcription elongation factor Spt4
MSQRLCPECRHPVHPRAEQCPNCGFRQPGDSESLKPNLPLVSATSPGLPAARCRQCEAELRGRPAVCPVCGAKTPLGRVVPWGPIALFPLVILLVLGSWVLYDRYIRSGDQQEDFIRIGAPPPTEVPRIQAYGFTARCTTPAPVYIFEAGTLPDAFIVVLAGRAGDSEKVTKTLVDRYDLRTRGYEPTKRGFAAVLSPGLVARLRCEPSVEALEEDPASRFHRDTTAR